MKGTLCLLFCTCKVNAHDILTSKLTSICTDFKHKGENFASKCVTYTVIILSISVRILQQKHYVVIVITFIATSLLH